jgi:hypothetical protein
MEEVMVAGASVPEVKSLSQIERVVDIFVAPTKTFTDILRSASWWLPFLLMLLASVAAAFSIDKKVGFDRVTQMAVMQNPQAADQMAHLTPEEQAARMSIATVITKDSVYAGGLFLLAIAALGALLLWASFNFGLGAQTTYGQNLAVFLYAYLPHLFLVLLEIVFLWMGVNTENFDVNFPVGTSLGYYFSDAPNWIRTALSFLDLFGLWSLVLMVLGMAIISRRSKTQAAVIVVGWWLLSLLATAGLTAMRG